jgi:DNA polymerase-3 subunit gamma/tau
VDAGTLRQRWPEILDAVRGERKVAWILLRNTSVESLEGGVLTVAFPREGEARGFAGSGHDQVLIGTLAAMMGVNVRVRAVAAGPGSPSAGPFSASQPAQAPSEEADDLPATSGRAAPASHPGPSPGAAGPGRDTGHPPSAPGNGNPGRPGGAADLAPDERPTPRPASSPGPGRQPAGPGRQPAGPGRRSAGTGSKPARGGQPSSSASPPQTPGPAEEQWPDDATGPGSADLSGMELIRRQLGGRVIEEIEDS